VAGVVAAVTVMVVGGVATDQSTAAGTKAAAERLKPGLLVMLVLLVMPPCKGVRFRGSVGAGALGRANRTGLLAALELPATASIPLPDSPVAADGTGEGPSIETNAEPNGDAGGTRIKAPPPPPPPPPAPND
jgi:hypothetical protein